LGHKNWSEIFVLPSTHRVEYDTSTNWPLSNVGFLAESEGAEFITAIIFGHYFYSTITELSICLIDPGVSFLESFDFVY
jgi:hypothetical protein